jgi:hypothetical protein
MDTLPSANYSLSAKWRAQNTVSQIMEVDNLTGRLTTDENRVLLADFAPFSLHQHKLRLLNQALRRSLTVDKTIGLATMGYALFQLYKNISIVNKKQQRDSLPKSIQTPSPPLRMALGSEMALHVHREEKPSSMLAKSCH